MTPPNALPNGETRLLRTSDDARWVRLRELLSARGIALEGAALAQFFSNDGPLEYGVLVTAEDAVIEFEFAYGRGDLQSQARTGVIATWIDQSAAWRQRPYRSDVEAAIRFLAAERDGRTRWFDAYVKALDGASVVAVGSHPYPCPCCGFLTLTERGGHHICKVCFWEDDGQDDHDADVVRGGPNGSLSLTAARANYLRIRACDERSVDHVRPPLAGEIPDDSR